MPFPARMSLLVYHIDIYRIATIYARKSRSFISWPNIHKGKWFLKKVLPYNKNKDILNKKYLQALNFF